MEHLDDNAASEFVSGALQPSALTKVDGHLAGCRDCRALVAALAQDAGDDSNAKTVPHDKLSPSQVAELPKRTLTIGDRVGRYLVLSTLGSGGMGVVHSAYDPQLDRKVALKLLRSGIQLNTKDAQMRLRREAQAIAQLSHPNVVAVYDVGTTDDGDLYIAMEFVEGDTLTTWLKRWPRTWREIVEVFLQAARGLNAAHSVGLLHRDFKPDNVLVGGDGRVRVTDFGLARSLIATITEESGRGTTPVLPAALSSPLTATGTVLGTPRYMPPEQLTGPNIDARSDQFSFCVALHEALYGVHPLQGSTSASMLENGAKAQPPPEGTRVPVQIGRAVARGLEADRTRRFPTIGELMSELVLPPQRSPARSIAIVLGGLLVMGIAAAAVFARPDAPDQLMPLDDKGVQPFVDQINSLKTEMALIKKERRELIKLIEELNKRPASEQAVVVLQQQLTEKDKQLTEKDKQIQSLVTQVTVLQTRGKPGRVVPSQRALVTAAVAMAQHNIDGCLDEWVERTKVANREGALITPDADLMVRLVVSPDGIGHSPMTTMRTSADRTCPKFDPNCFDSPSLRSCVESAIAGVKFPLGNDQLDLEVGVAWSQGLLNLSPRVVGHHTAPRETIDLR